MTKRTSSKMGHLGLFASLLLASQIAIAYAGCPFSLEPTCANAILEGYGCGTYGTLCCQYGDYRCPGETTTSRVWTPHPTFTCRTNLHGEYHCM